MEIQDKPSEEDITYMYRKVTDYKFYDETYYLSQEEFYRYIRKKLRWKTIDLIFESFGYFIIVGCIFGGLAIGVGNLLQNNPMGPEDFRNSRIAISIGFALMVSSFLLCFYIFTKAIKLFRQYKNEDITALYEMFNSVKDNRNATKTTRKEYAQIAIISLLKDKIDRKTKPFEHEE